VTHAAASKAESRPGLGQAASLTERRLALVRQREAQAARLTGLRNTTHGVPHIASDGQVLTAQLAGTRQLLAEVGAALQRIDDGTYGICGECGADIAADLLQAVPLARLCMSCQHNENR
jgi:DnaK suppressor protein